MIAQLGLITCAGCSPVLLIHPPWRQQTSYTDPVIICVLETACRESLFEAGIPAICCNCIQLYSIFTHEHE